MIVYKVLTGNYPFIPQEKYFDSRIKYYYFHTHDILNKSGKWKFIKINIEKSLLYTQRKYKILSHKLFNEPSIYLDYEVTPKENIFDKAHEMLSVSKFNTAIHPYRKTFLDECCDWLFFDVKEKELIKITRYLKYIKYNFDLHFGSLCGYLIRHQSENINNMWWYFWKKFQKRDQLWLPPAVYFTKSKINLFNDYDLFDPFDVTLPHFLPRTKPTNKLNKLINTINMITGRKDKFNLNILKKRLK